MTYWETRLAKFMGDAARPFALMIIAFATALAIGRIVLMGRDLSNGAVFIAACGGIVGALYGFKSAENANIAKHAAQADAAKATAGAAATADAQPS